MAFELKNQTYNGREHWVVEDARIDGLFKQVKRIEIDLKRLIEEGKLQLAELKEAESAAEVKWTELDDNYIGNESGEEEKAYEDAYAHFRELLGKCDAVDGIIDALNDLLSRLESAWMENYY